MPPYCMVCNADLAGDGGASNWLCSFHLNAKTQRETESRLSEELQEELANAITGNLNTELVDVVKERSPGQGKTNARGKVWITFDTPQGRLFAKSVKLDRFVVTTDWEAPDSYSIPLSGPIVSTYQEAVGFAMGEGYRFATKAPYAIPEHVLADLLQRQLGVQRSGIQLHKGVEWGKYEVMGYIPDTASASRAFNEEWQKVAKSSQQGLSHSLTTIPHPPVRPLTTQEQIRAEYLKKTKSGHGEYDLKKPSRISTWGDWLFRVVAALVTAAVVYWLIWKFIMSM